MEIKIYITPTCPWCIKLKEWLKKKKLSFQEIDVTESETARDEIIERTSQMSVPVIEIDGQMIVGFNEKKLKGIVEKSQK